MYDRLYGWEQESTSSFYVYEQMAISYDTSSNGSIKGDASLFCVASHTLLSRQIMVTAFKLTDTQELEHQETRIFTETSDIQILGAGADYDKGPWFVTVFYKTAGSNDRGKLF